METRSRKRRRTLSRTTPSTPTTTRGRSSRKRTHDEADSPTHVSRKRRRSTTTANSDNENNAPLQQHKRARMEQTDKPGIDTEMTDTMSQKPRLRPKKRLRDILRQERVHRAVLRELQINYARTRAAQQQQQQAQQQERQTPNIYPQQNGRTSDAHRFDPRTQHRFTGDEEVCEVETIDVSETTEGLHNGRARAPGVYPGAEDSPAGQGDHVVQPSVEAVLLEDGRCAVQIIRQDGSMQRVIIQPPEWHDY